MALLLTLSGVQILIGGQQPNSVNASLPPVLLFVWAAVLAAGGSLVVLAAIVRPFPALYLELAADLPLSLMCGVYVASVLTFAGSRGLVSAALASAAALAFAIRGVQVARTLAIVRREIRKL